ncbi:hypothetical protein CVT24_011481 [Panaeolus cyanescens]|uniref:N-acetyltransferase domain-containing protein n=1 Tax=Panaeolus cyanescens TaxID=181874 RepID=A0A409VGK3_9AGAR|nr:hypothetical protein CVT24_011481 [Panaeolus cyanescens]
MLAAEPHQVITAKTLKELAQCIKIRIIVFTHEQQFPIEAELDEHVKDTLNANAAHFLLQSTPSLMPIGTIRACKFTSTQITENGLHSTKTYYKLTRFAILKEFRGKHLGEALVHRLHEWVLEDAAKDRLQTLDGTSATVTIIAHSQIYATGFYAR